MNTSKDTGSEGTSHKIDKSSGEIHVHVHNQETGNYPSEEIELSKLFKHFWDKRYFIAKFATGLAIVGVLIAFISPVEYESTASLMQESQSPQSTAQSLLQQYGGFLGISNSGTTAGGNISSQMYPKITESVPFQLELMQKPIYFSTIDTTLRLKDYFHSVHEPAMLDYVKEYTLGLPRKIINLPATVISWFSSGSTSSPAPATRTEFRPDSIYVPTSREMSTMSILNSRVNINQEDGGGTIQVSVLMPDPRAAAETAQKAIQLLKEYVQEYRTQKAKSDLSFIQEQVDRVRAQFEEAQLNLAEFRDSNVNISTARARTREQELQTEYDRYSSLYNSLSQQLERAKISVQESTPVFSILEPVQQPIGKSKPNYEFIVIASFLIGIVLACGWVFFLVFREVFIWDPPENS